MSDWFKTAAGAAAYSRRMSTSPSTHATPSAPRFAAIGMTVADMAASLAFYRRLGLDVPAEADTAPHADAPLPGGLRLMWDAHETARAIDPDWTPPQAGARTGAGLRLRRTGRGRQGLRGADAAGCTGEKAPWDAFWGQRFAVVQDPDGHGVDLFAPLPEQETA